MTNTGNRDRVGSRGHPLLWPSRRSDLVDTTRCPACFETLSSAVCAHCGLDLRHSSAADLLRTSVGIADALDRRAGIIGRIRMETDAAAHAQREADEHARQPAVTTPPTTLAASPPAHHAPPVGSAPPVGAAPPVVPVHAQSPRRRVSSVQLALLIAGVSLLSVFAIFFLVYAFINYGIIWRSVIIGTITLAAFTTAALLQRRGLRASAEGIGVFAIVLVYLDAYALRANDLFGTADVDGSLYWGITVATAATGFILWHRVSGLRAPSLVGFASFAPGVGTVAYGLSESLEFLERTVVVLAAVALAGLVHRSAGRPSTASPTGIPARVERSVVLTTTAAALVGASILATLLEPSDNDPTASVLGLLVVALIATGHLGVLWNLPGRPRGWARVIAVPLGTSTAALGAAFWVHTGAPDGTLVLPTAVAVIAALGFDSASRRVDDAMLAAAARAAAISAAVVLGIAASVPITSALTFTVATIARAIDRAWIIGPLDTIAEPAVADALVVVALASVGVLTAIAWRLDGLLARRAPALGFYTAGVLALAAPLAGAAALVMGVWLALAAVALIVVAIGRERIAPLRPALITLYGVSLALGWTTGWASESTWPVAAGTAVLLLGAGRAIVSAPVGSAPTGSGPTGRGPIGRAVFLGASTVMLLVAAATLVRQLGFAADPSVGVWVTDAVRGATVVALAVVILAAVVTGRLLSGLDRRVMFWLHGSVAIIGVLVTRSVFRQQRLVAPGEPEPGAFLGVIDATAPAVVIAALVLVANVLWVAPRWTAEFRVERIVASVALGPAIYLVVDSFVQVIDAPELARSVAPITAALLSAAGSLAVALLRRASTIPRGLREVGVTLVGVPAVIVALVNPGGATWLVLLISAVTVLVLSISADGLFASRSPRRHLGWAAIGLAVAGLWVRLSEDSVSAVEPYVLPLGGILLLVALLLWWAGRRVGATSAGPPLVALAALLVGILPVASVAATGAPVRAFVVGAVSAGLLLAGSFVRTGSGSRPVATTGSDDAITGIGQSSVGQSSVGQNNVGQNNVGQSSVGQSSVGPGSGIRPYLDVAALAGAIGVTVTMIGRAWVLAWSRPGSGELDAWLGAGVGLLVVAAFGIATVAPDRFSPQRMLGARAIAIIALTASTTLEGIAITRSDGTLLRPLAVVLLLSAVHVIAFTIDRLPLDRLLAWLAVGYAAIVAGVALGAGSLDPVEAGSIPIAIALIATGVVRLDESERPRSWPWLGPGVTLLLLPSIISTIDDRPLWRLVGVGVVGVAVMVIGLTRRLQAPFVVGAVLVVVHAVATFAPEIRAVYESVAWWLWLGIGGLILTVLAARYEQRIKNVRDVVERIGSLR